MQWTIHTCPKTLRKTFEQIFVDVPLDNLLIVPTWQKTKTDMSSFSDEVQEEREEKSKTFIEWGENVVEEIKKKGHWADIIDPTSGSTCYAETDDAVHVLGYEVIDLGCCKAVSHSEWGTHAMLSTLFSTAPQDILREILEKKSK